MGVDKLWRRLGHLVSRRRHDAELAEELRLHRELTQARLEREGISAGHAPAAARRRLGNDTLAREAARDVWGWQWLDALRQDVRFAVRLLTRERQFSLAVIVALGLAIGLNNSVFTVINTALIRDLPFDEPRRLLDLALLDASGREAGLSYPDYRRWSQARTLDGISLSSDSIMNLSGDDGAPVRLRGSFVTANTFALLRVAPIVGRDFRAEDDVVGAAPVAILGFKVWQDRYAGDPAVVGRTVRLNRIEATIVGVMPESFSYPFIAEAWQPLAASPGFDPLATTRPFRNVIARLSAGAELPAAQTEIAAIEAASRPAASALRPHLKLMREGIGGQQARTILMTFMGAVGLVLLIACANVASLLLARAMARSREMALRASLGATRWRLARQLLIECLVLALLAGGVGLAVSFYGARTLAVGFSVLEPGVEAGAVMPFWVNLTPDAVVLAFVGTACLTSTLLFGLVPALHLAGTNVHGILKQGGRGALAGPGARRWTNAFIVAELALTVMLLAGAGLLWRSFYAHYRQDLVVDPAGLITARFALEHETSPASRGRAVESAAAALERTFGVGAVTFASQPPLIPGGAARKLVVEGAAPPAGAEPAPVSVVYIGRRYFETLGIAVDANASVDLPDSAVVDERFAATYLQGRSPLGQRIRITTGNTAGSGPWLTITGIVRAIPDFSPPPMRHPVVYAPLASGRDTTPDLSIVVRSGAPLSVVAPRVREEIRRIAPDAPVHGVEAVAAAAARGRSGQRLAGTIFAAIAVVGLLLSTVGVYALTAYAVAQRRFEVGVRIALGARPREVVWLFVRRTALHLAIGLAVGVGGALAAGRLLQSFLVDVGPRDPLTIAGVVVLLAATAVLAALLPSRRAARIEPIAALRTD